MEKFEASWEELLEGVRKSLDAAAEGLASPPAAEQNAEPPSKLEVTRE